MGSLFPVLIQKKNVYLFKDFKVYTTQEARICCIHVYCYRYNVVKVAPDIITYLASNVTTLPAGGRSLHISFPKHNSEGRLITHNQTRNPSRVVPESANVVACVGADETVSDFVTIIDRIDHLNLELPANVRVKLAGFQEILPGFTVVQNPPEHTAYTQSGRGDEESEALESRHLDGGGGGVHRRDDNRVAGN